MNTLNLRALAADLGITVANVEAAKELLRAGDAELISDVLAGKVTLAAALQRVTQKNPQQRRR